MTGAPTFEQVVHWPKAIPQYEVGYGHFKDLMNDVERQAPGFFLGGHFRDGVSLGDSIVAGLRAAERVRDFVKARGAPAPTASPAPATA